MKQWKIELYSVRNIVAAPRGRLPTRETRRVAAVDKQMHYRRVLAMAGSPAGDYFASAD